MIEDDIITEVRAAREAFAKRHDFDVRKIVADLQARDAAGDWPVVSFITEPTMHAAPSSAAAAGTASVVNGAVGVAATPETNRGR